MPDLSILSMYSVTKLYGRRQPVVAILKLKDDRYADTGRSHKSLLSGMVSLTERALN